MVAKINYKDPEIEETEELDEDEAYIKETEIVDEDAPEDLWDGDEFVGEEDQDLDEDDTF